LSAADNAALDALAVALAPRLLREVRALIAADSGDDDEALAMAVAERMGYVFGPAPGGTSCVSAAAPPPGRNRRPKQR